MIPARAKKVIGDLCVRWGRSLLTLFGLSLGLCAASGTLVALVYLANDLGANYQRTNPPNIIVDAASASPAALKRIRSLAGVTAVETRSAFVGRIEAGPNHWLPLTVWVVDDFKNQRVAKFYHDGGAWPPPPGSMLIERDGRFFVWQPLGSALRVRLPDDKAVAAVLSGYAYDPGQAPSRMEQVIYAYVTPATLQAWSYRPTQTRLLITTAPGTSARVVASQVRGALHGEGVPVGRIEAHDVPHHPHQFQFDAVLALLGGITVVAFAMCAVLSVNLVDAIMLAEQRAIGVMKAIGATGGQIARDYLIGIGMLGLAASLISLSLALSWGHTVARVVAMFFNVELITQASPVWLSMMVLAIGALAPVAAASLGVLRATSKPVREAISRGAASADTRLADSLSWVFSPLPLVARMAGRTTLRSFRRALLTALTLAIGLTFFMTALNLRASLLETVDAVRRTKPYDLAVTFRAPYPTERLKVWIGGFPAVTRAEFWTTTQAEISRPDGVAGDAVEVMGVPPRAAAVRPDLIAGRWIGGAPDGIVVTQKLLVDQPELKLGGAYRLAVGDRVVAVHVIGIVREFGPAVIYAPAAMVDSFVQSRGQSNLMLASLASASYYDEMKAAAGLEESLIATDWQISRVLPSHMLEAIVKAHLDGLAILLLGIAGFALIVGALGLASSVSVSVVQRYREIGVLKAIGAQSPAIAALFVWEAVFIGLIGWGMAMVMAPWLSRMATAGLGQLIIQYPFDDRAALWGAPAALGVALVIAILASLLPIRTALKATAHRSLRSE